MPRLTTTRRRLRSDVRCRPWLKKYVCRQCQSKNYAWICFATSYQLPTTGSKQRLVERITQHIRYSAAKKTQRSHIQPPKPGLRAKDQQVSLNSNTAVLAQRLVARILPVEMRAALNTHPAVYPAVVEPKRHKHTPTHTVTCKSDHPAMGIN